MKETHFIPLDATYLIPLFIKSNINAFPEEDLKENNLITYRDLNIISKISIKEFIINGSKKFNFYFLIKTIAEISNWERGINGFLWKFQIDFNLDLPEFYKKDKIKSEAASQNMSLNKNEIK